jgi:hypothetical protein
VKSGTGVYHVQASKFRVYGGGTESVSAQGEATFVTPSIADPNVKVRHTLKLAGNTGTGSYQAIDRPCIGSWALKKVAEPSALPQSSK